MPPLTIWIAGSLFLLLIAYGFGSIPTGHLVGRWLKGIDIRTQGSGSTGATNVLRLLGKGPGLMVLLIDVLKGAAAVALARFAFGANSQVLAAAPTPSSLADWSTWVIVACGMMAILGHSKSVWLNFSGGKSVATGLGVLLMLHWPAGLFALALFGVVLALSRIVSLSSILAALAVPLAMAYLQQPLAYILFGLAGGLYVIVRHRANIARLIAGTEPRLGQTVVSSTQP